MMRTVSIPVDLPSERFLPLMAQCSEIFNAHVDWALENGTYNKSKAHRALYADLRQQYPGVPSALLQTVRDNAMAAVKATKFQRRPRKKPTSGLRYDKRTMTLRGQQLTLSCLGKRERIILDVPDYFKEVYETWDFKGATLTYTKHKRQFWVRLVFETETPALQPAGEVQGLDRGLYHLVVTSDGEFFSSSEVRATQRRYLHKEAGKSARYHRSGARRSVRDSQSATRQDAEQVVVKLVILSARLLSSLQGRSARQAGCVCRCEAYLTAL